MDYYKVISDAKDKYCELLNKIKVKKLVKKNKIILVDLFNGWVILDMGVI